MGRLWGSSSGETVKKQLWRGCGETAPDRMWGSPSACDQAMRRGNFHEKKKGPHAGAGPAAPERWCCILRG